MSSRATLDPPLQNGHRDAAFEAALMKHGVPASYRDLILAWMADAADFRIRARSYQNDIELIESDIATKRDVIGKTLKTAETLPSFAAAIDRDKLEALELHFQQEPELLEYLYLVRRGQGRRVSDQGLELDALIRNFIGLWRDMTGEFTPAVQGTANKQADEFDENDENGEPPPQPFIAMTVDLLKALGRDGLIRGTAAAAKKIKRELENEQKQRSSY